MWIKRGNYTGFNATEGEAITVVSTSANDCGTLVSSGTATGGSTTTLVDSSATFSTDGVVAGDLIINDTQRIHGIITAVMETTLTVLRMADASVSEDNTANAVSDYYRIASTANTGAAVITISKLISSGYTDLRKEYIILNGTTGVDSTGTSYIRNSSASVILAGSAGNNVGTITGNQKITTANIFWEMPSGLNRTQVCADTTPKNKWLYMTNLSCRASGYCTVYFQVRKYGEVFLTKVNAEISSAQDYESSISKVFAIPPCSDFKWRVASTVADNTFVTAEMNGLMVTVSR